MNTSTGNTCVAIVDDDPDILALLTALLSREAIQCKAYASGRSFLDDHDFSCHGCAVVDLVMPDISGMEVVEELRKRGCQLPLIMLTGYGDIERAVHAMKGGVFDFLQKPTDPKTLVATVSRALDADATHRKNENEAEDAVERLISLSAREREVLKLIIEGNQSRAIAKSLNISVHTVDNHRAHIMRKMRADSLADLVRIACLYANRAGYNWKVS